MKNCVAEKKDKERKTHSFLFKTEAERVDGDLDPHSDWQKAKAGCGLKEEALKPRNEFEPMCFLWNFDM